MNNTIKEEKDVRPWKERKKDILQYYKKSMTIRDHFREVIFLVILTTIVCLPIAYVILEWLGLVAALIGVSMILFLRYGAGWLFPHEAVIAWKRYENRNNKG